MLPILWRSRHFDAATETKPLLHLWSLGIEEQFYIIWPLLLIFAWKRKISLLIVTMIVLFISFSFNIFNIKTDPIATFYSPLTRIWELLFGSVLSWIMVFKKDAFANFNFKINKQLSRYKLFNNAEEKYICQYSFNIRIVLFIIGFVKITKSNLSFLVSWALVPVLGTVVIIMV